jgi:pyruvate dehydrogenase E2 component (dihydrolipoamide acetyltransferase)
MPAAQQIETVVTGVSQHALATPFVRKLARELGVNIEKIKGTGPQGRVSEQDVRNATAGSKSEGTQPASSQSMYVLPSSASSIPSEAPRLMPQKIPLVLEGTVERIPFKGLRRSIAQHMVASFSTAVHVTHVDEVDITALATIRDREKPMAEASGIKLTYLPFVVKALIAGLRAFPVFNASLDEQNGDIVLKKYYHIGIAVDTEEGLMVPIIKDADKKTIMGIAQEIQELAEKARARKLTLDQMKGGSCTITNIGSAGGIFATPIINYPESSILGLYRIQDKVAVVKDEAEIRKMMNVSITFDHRVIDGAQAARFVTYIKKHIEDPGLLLIHE